MANRSRILICLFITLLLVVFDPCCYAEFKKTKVSIVNFELLGDKQKRLDMFGIIAKRFFTALVEDGHFQVVRRTLLKRIVDEQKLGMACLIDESSAAQRGIMLGMKIIISGSVFQFPDTIEANTRIINIGTKFIVAAKNLLSNSSDNPKNAIECLTRILKCFHLTGYMIKKLITT